MNYFKILQLLRPHIKAGRLDYQGAVLYLQKLGIKMDGILKKGLDNLFKKGKARDPDFGNVVQKLPKDDAGKLFNPKNPLKDYSKKNLVKGKNKEGVETLFEETEVFSVPRHKINYKLMEEKLGVKLRGDETWEQLIKIEKNLKKADGGRVGFDTGGLSEQEQSIYDAWIAAGHSEEDVLAFLASRGLDGLEEGSESIVNVQPNIIDQGGSGGAGIRTYVPLSERNKVTIPSLTKAEQAKKALWENQPWTSDMETTKAFWENQPDISVEENVGFLEGLKNRAGDVWSGITGSKAGQAFNKYAFSPMMALANRYNPLSPDAVNFNPMLESQKDLALRPTTMGGLGFQQDDIGRFLGSANPEDEDYNPLLGQNLVSMFGTNDLTQMLRNRLQKIRTRKIGQTDSSRLKQEKILELINQAVADESAGYTGTPGGNVGSGVFATIDSSGKTYGPYTPQGNQGGNRGSFTGQHPDTPNRGSPTQQAGGWHPGVKDGGLATMFQRR